MKLAKTIIIIVLSVLLAFSAFFNIFIMTVLEIKNVESFKQVLLCRELINSTSQLLDTEDTSVEETPNTEPSDTEKPIPETPETELLTNTEVPVEPCTVYDEEGIKITFVEQEIGPMGCTLKFYIENNTKYTLDICLTDVYIDGFKAEYCGVYCSGLEAGKKSYETLVLWEADYEDFTEFPTLPSVVQFAVKVKDPAARNILVETAPIHLCLF
jgi:hypothetical protein